MIVEITDDVINDVIDDEFLNYIHILTNYSAFQRKLSVDDEYLNTNEEYHTKRPKRAQKHCKS